MDFAYQLLKGEFDSIIPLSYIFLGISLAVIISMLNFFTTHLRRKEQRIETGESKGIDACFYEERLKNVL